MPDTRTSLYLFANPKRPPSLATRPQILLPRFGVTDDPTELTERGRVHLLTVEVVDGDRPVLAPGEAVWEPNKEPPLGLEFMSPQQVADFLEEELAATGAALVPVHRSVIAAAVNELRDIAEPAASRPREEGAEDMRERYTSALDAVIKDGDAIFYAHGGTTRELPASGVAAAVKDQGRFTISGTGTITGQGSLVLPKKLDIPKIQEEVRRLAGQPLGLGSKDIPAEQLATWQAACFAFSNLLDRFRVAAEPLTELTGKG